MPPAAAANFCHFPPKPNSRELTLGALSIVRAAIGDAALAVRLVRMGLVLKLTALVRQFTQGPPPPLPPRGGSVSPRGASPTVDFATAVPAAGAFEDEDKDEASRERKGELEQVRLCGCGYGRG